MLNESIYLNYLNALLEGDKKTCVDIVAGLLDKDTPPKEIYIDLLQRSMYKVGQLWENDKCTVASEHIATKITEHVLSYTCQNIKKNQHNGKVIVVACIDKEFHELGPRIVSDYFEIHGWTSIFLGANTPKCEILNMIEKKQPELVGLSSNFYINILRLMKIIEEVLDRFPQQKIIIGGQALANEKCNGLKNFRNVKYIPTLEYLDKSIFYE